MLENNQKEIFKDVLGYDGLYQVSNLGNVISVERYVKRSNNSILKVKSKEKSKSIHTHGYLKVKLYKNNIGKDKYVHRLVVESFISEIPKSMQINHKDGNKKNNHIDNLEIVTPLENNLHAIATNLKKEQLGSKCINNKTGYTNISIKKVRGNSFYCVCIRHNGIRYEKLRKNLSEAIHLHNDYMKSIGKEHLVHSF